MSWIGWKVTSRRKTERAWIGYWKADFKFMNIILRKQIPSELRIKGLNFKSWAEFKNWNNTWSVCHWVKFRCADIPMTTPKHSWPTQKTLFPTTRWKASTETMVKRAVLPISIQISPVFSKNYLLMIVDAPINWVNAVRRMRDCNQNAQNLHFNEFLRFHCSSSLINLSIFLKSKFLLCSFIVVSYYLIKRFR